MKLQLYRHSGLPIDLESLKAYRAEYQQMYDEAVIEAGADMEKMQTLAEALETALNAKYNVAVYAELPKTAKAWEKLIATYGGDPIMVGQRNGVKGLLLVIMDQF